MHFSPSRRTTLTTMAAWGLGALATAAHAAPLSEIQARKTLNVGIQTDYPPYGLSLIHI